MPRAKLAQGEGFSLVHSRGDRNQRETPMCNSRTCGPLRGACIEADSAGIAHVQLPMVATSIGAWIGSEDSSQTPLRGPFAGHASKPTAQAAAIGASVETA